MAVGHPVPHAALFQELREGTLDEVVERAKTSNWGNVVFVTDESADDDGGRWVDAFQSAFPEATWSWTTYSRLAPCPGRRRFPRDARSAASA